MAGRSGSKLKAGLRAGKRPGFFFLLAFVFSFQLPASMISVLVVETGIKEGGNAGQYSSLWEDGLLSVFFDAGHIISNGNILRLEKMPSKALPDEVLLEHRDAFEGGADYFVLAILKYENINGRMKPQEVTLRIFSTSSTGMLCQRIFPAGPGQNLDDEYKRAKEAARTIIPHIKD
ncbi:MAG: hypothetical protein LBH43_21475 [Treponema sp.]|nr:hypothetical protein [Treponema sp.]